MTTKKKTTTAIHFEMDEETNRAVTSSAKKNGRTKRKEASARLKDHVAKYGSEFTEK
ncbi:TraY domain-containing protein [Aliivibrio sifiae]